MEIVKMILDFLGNLFGGQKTETHIHTTNVTKQVLNASNRTNRSHTDYKRDPQNIGNGRKAYVKSDITVTTEAFIVGAKGKVYTKDIHRKIIKSFGIEVTVKNHTSKNRVINISCCIFNNNEKNVYKNTRKLILNGKEKAKVEFIVREQKNLRFVKGRHKVKIWADGGKKDKFYINLMDK